MIYHMIPYITFRRGIYHIYHNVGGFKSATDLYVLHYCAAVCCLSLSLSLLLLLLFRFPLSMSCLRVLVCSVIVEARRSVTRARFRPPAPTLLYYYYRKPGLLQIKPTPSSLLWLGGALG